MIFIAKAYIFSYSSLIMIFVAIMLFICAVFFFMKSIHENSVNDRILAGVLLIVALFALFAGLAALHTLKQYGV